MSEKISRKKINEDENFISGRRRGMKLTKLKRENENRDEKIILSAIIVAIIVVSGMLIYSLLTIEEEKFSYIGILDENKTTSNYPDVVYNNTPFFLWIDIGNYEGNLNLYLVNLTLGNVNSTINKTHPSGSSAMYLKSYYCILENDHSKMIHANLSINLIANNSRLIFELWTFNLNNDKFEYMGIWAQIWINITQSS
ncbi:MAG: DUF1616 domain-containing protein [Candidatus Lokiarchaeota archaeon]|nr:DUF1616 domain-containing protein [Candidatus Lokiarchaeota archaeon]